MNLLADLRNLDRHDIGGWPVAVKVFLIGLVLVVAASLGWTLLLGGQRETLAALVRKEAQLKQSYAQKQALTLQLEFAQRQLDALHEGLDRRLRRLPSRAQLPALLMAIAQAALSAGLQVELFQPGAETLADGYAVQAIQLRMLGSTHQFAGFVRAVAALSPLAILGLRDVALAPRPPVQGIPADDRLLLQGTLEIYRHLDESEATGARR